MSQHAHEPRLDRKTKTALILFLIGVIASVAGLATWSAFSATTSNAANQFETGTVLLSDNDDSDAMFTMTAVGPGDTVSKCITVTYNGSLASNVKLYGQDTGGTNLDDYLDLKVTRGSFSGATPDEMACTNGLGSNFVPDSSSNTGGANGVLFDAKMNTYPATWLGGISDAPGGTAENWTNNESHVYRFDVTVANDPAGANKTHTRTFTWEAQDA